MKNLKDVCEGDIMVERADADTYLGDIISKDGSNKKNIMARKAKGHGIVGSIAGECISLEWHSFQ